MALILAVLALTLAPAAPAASAAPLQAGDPDVTTTVQEGTGVREPAQQAPDIVQKPGAGQQPQDAGDRGGALQALLFAAIVLGVAALAALVIRESRRKQRSDHLA